MDQIYPKKVFPIKNWRSGHHHWILYSPISLRTQLQLKMTILVFWTKFALKGYFWSKTEKSHHHHWIVYIQISTNTKFGLGTKFQCKLTILTFWTNLPKKANSFWKQKKWLYHHWILHIQIGLSTKFQCKLTILIFWAEFTQKGCFRSKIKNLHLHVFMFVSTILNFSAQRTTDCIGICKKKTVFVTRQGKAHKVPYWWG